MNELSDAGRRRLWNEIQAQIAFDKELDNMVPLTEKEVAEIEAMFAGPGAQRIADRTWIEEMIAEGFEDD